MTMSEETLNQLPDGFKRVEQANVFKFEREGDFIRGLYLGIEEAKKFPGSYALKYRDHVSKESMVVFVNNIVKDVLSQNADQIFIGKTEIFITFKGKQKTQDGSREYNDFDLAFK